MTQLPRLWSSKECISTVVPSGLTYRLRTGTEEAVEAAGVDSAVAEVVASVAAAGVDSAAAVVVASVEAVGVDSVVAVAVASVEAVAVDSVVVAAAEEELLQAS